MPAKQKKMNNNQAIKLSSFGLRPYRLSIGFFLMLGMAACSSQGARDAEIAAEESARVATEQEAARVAQQEARQRAEDMQRQREVQAADTARLQAQRERDAEAARLRAEQERQQREEAERREEARLVAIAAAEDQRQEKLDRITELEQQLAAVQAEAGNVRAGNDILQQAIIAAEELLDVLTAEQAKYEDTDADGNPVNPLSKDLIAELEARKDNLVRQAEL